jgi:hypothetical protein
MRRLASVVLAGAIGLAGCAGASGLNVAQGEGWAAFQDCRGTVAPSAALGELRQSGVVTYETREGSEFSLMKSCMETRGYACDLGVGIGARPNTDCYPRKG